jgi:chromosome segregation ATPase
MGTSSPVSSRSVPLPATLRFIFNQFLEHTELAAEQQEEFEELLNNANNVMLEEKRKDVNKLKQKELEFEQKNNEMVERMKQSEKQTNDLQRANAILMDEAGQVLRVLKKLRQKIVSVEREREEYKKQNNVLQQRVKELTDEGRKLKNESIETASQLGSKMDEVKELNKLIQQYQDKLQTAKREAQKLETNIEELQNQVTALQPLEALAREAESLRVERVRLVEASNVMERERDAANTNWRETMDLVDTLRKEVREAGERERAAIQKVVKWWGWDEILNIFVKGKSK